MKTNSLELQRLPKKLVKRRDLRPDEFLTTDELMTLLKVGHKQTVYKLIKQGMPVILVGKNYRFLKSEVIQYLRISSKNSKRKSGKRQV